MKQYNQHSIIHIGILCLITVEALNVLINKYLFSMSLEFRLTRK